jgi:hypothetical protein
VNIFKLRMLIAIDIVDIEKIFINFRIRTLAINIIPKFSTNIRAIRKNIKIIKIVVNSRKKKIISLNIIKEIPIRMRKKLNDNRDFFFLIWISERYLLYNKLEFLIYLITHDINVYRNTHSQNLDNMVVKYSNL